MQSKYLSEIDSLAESSKLSYQTLKLENKQHQQTIDNASNSQEIDQNNAKVNKMSLNDRMWMLRSSLEKGEGEKIQKNK